MYWKERLECAESLYLASSVEPCSLEISSVYLYFVSIFDIPGTG